MKTIHIILLLFGFLLVNCDNDPVCPDPYEMGSFEMLESSKDKFPYDTSQTKVIFSDSLGNEYIGTLESINNGFGMLTGPNRTCIDNEDISIEVRARTENLSASIQIPEISMVLNINYRVSPDLVNYESGLIADIAIVSGPQPQAGPIPQLFIVLDERSQQGNLTAFTQPVPTLTIHEKTYEQVFSNEYRPIDNYLIFYNFEQGIVGFTNKSTGDSYKFERVE